MPFEQVPIQQPLSAGMEEQYFFKKKKKLKTFFAMVPSNASEMPSVQSCNILLQSVSHGTSGQEPHLITHPSLLRNTNFSKLAPTKKPSILGLSSYAFAVVWTSFAFNLKRTSGFDLAATSKAKLERNNNNNNKSVLYSVTHPSESLSSIHTLPSEQDLS